MSVNRQSPFLSTRKTRVSGKHVFFVCFSYKESGIVLKLSFIRHGRYGTSAGPTEAEVCADFSSNSKAKLRHKTDKLVIMTHFGLTMEKISHHGIIQSCLVIMFSSLLIKSSELSLEAAEQSLFYFTRLHVCLIEEVINNYSAYFWRKQSLMFTAQ